MKRPTQQLLDDLLDDSAPPEFRATLLDKTLRSARQRKRGRRVKLVLAITVIPVVLAFMLWESTLPKTVRQPFRPSASPVATAPQASPLQSPLQIINTQPNSAGNRVAPEAASGLTLVQTSAAARPQEINDQQLLALLAGQPVALVNHGAHKAELWVFNSQ